jgi:hypothetical protein
MTPCCPATRVREVPTNDLDAMGRVCSALPGSKVVGMGARNARHDSAGTRELRPDHPGV